MFSSARNGHAQKEEPWDPSVWMAGRIDTYSSVVDVHVLRTDKMSTQVALLLTKSTNDEICSLSRTQNREHLGAIGG